jgi:UDP-glucose 4-epimerase
MLVLSRKPGERILIGEVAVEAAEGLGVEAPKVLARRAPAYRGIYERRGWNMFPRIDRVYVNARARTALGWTPRYDFAQVLARLAQGEDFGSPLALAVGVKGYHDREFADGPYPVD